MVRNRMSPPVKTPGNPTLKTVLVCAAFVAVHVGVSLACMLLLSWHFYHRYRIVLFHETLVVGTIALTIAAFRFASHQKWLAGTTINRALLSLGAAAATSGLALLYLLDFAGNEAWGGNVNYQIVWQYAVFALPGRTPFYMSPWVHVFLAGTYCLIALVYWFGFLVVLPTTIPGSAAKGWRDDVSVNRRRWLLAGGLVAYATAFGVFGVPLARDGAIAREPVVGFLTSSTSIFNFTEYSYSRDQELPQRELRARAEYPRGLSFAKRNVIVVVVDSLRADHMSVYGYDRPTTPFLSNLASTGRAKVVQLALSTCSETNCGILSTMTSRPAQHLIPGNFSLANLLQDQGYAAYQILSGNHDWRGLRQAYGYEQALYFDSTNSTKYPMNDDRVVLEGLAHVPDFSGRPAFFQFHLMSVHQLGVKHDAFRRYQPSKPGRDLGWLLRGRDDEIALTNNYDNGILEADDTIRQLFDVLQTKGYLAHSLVVITSDHGEGLAMRGLGHSDFIYQEHIRIPLLFYDDPKASYANLTFATQIDVAPTLLDRLGLPIPSSWEGRSLLSPDVKHFSYHESNPGNPCYAVVDRQPPAIFKYIECDNDTRSARELYDIAADPLESHNLATRDPALLRDLRNRLHEYLTTLPRTE